jgi:hypothetical protein
MSIPTFQRAHFLSFFFSFFFLVLEFLRYRGVDVPNAPLAASAAEAKAEQPVERTYTFLGERAQDSSRLFSHSHIIYLFIVAVIIIILSIYL